MKTFELRTGFLLGIGWTAAALAQAQPSVAVIGGGASGLTTAWLLERDYKVTLFEKESRLGGHADSVALPNGKSVEAGFEFFSPKIFPHFFRLLNHLQVPTHEFGIRYSFYRTDGSLGLRLPPDVFAAIGNMSLLGKFNEFLQHAARLVENQDQSLTVGAFTDSLNLDEKFKTDFLYPFLASMWGVGPRDIPKFAALPVVSWLVLSNTGTLEPPRWHEVAQGTAAYIEALSSQIRQAEILLDAEVTQVTRLKSGKYRVSSKRGVSRDVDSVVFATNAFVARKLAENLPGAGDALRALSRFKYFKTVIAIHGDRSRMPKDKGLWGEVNVGFDGVQSAITVYKSWRTEGGDPVFKSWVTREAALGLPLPKPLYATREYYHAQVDLDYVRGQNELRRVQGREGLWFAGVYTGKIDSHESAIVSAVDIAKVLAPHSERLKVLVPEL